MPRKLACFLCHGLLIGQPVDDLAAFLNQNTPNSVHFNTVGGADPQPYQAQITQQVIDAKNGGAEIIFAGHSMGADLAFYLADRLKSLNIRAPLFISIDSTDWGSNAPGTQPWSLLSATPGTWLVPDNVDCWLHFRQPFAPGGGQASLAPGNAKTNLSVDERGESHLGIVTAPQVEQAILSAVLEVTNTPVA